MNRSVCIEDRVRFFHEVVDEETGDVRKVLRIDTARRLLRMVVLLALLNDGMCSPQRGEIWSPDWISHSWILGWGRKGPDCLEQLDETFLRAKCVRMRKPYLSECHRCQLGSWTAWGTSFLRVSGDGIMSASKMAMDSLKPCLRFSGILQIFSCDEVP